MTKELLDALNKYKFERVTDLNPPLYINGPTSGYRRGGILLTDGYNGKLRFHYVSGNIDITKPEQIEMLVNLIESNE